MSAATRDDVAFKALAHTDRRRLLRLCGDDERSAGVLANEAGLSQPIASQHLRVLRDASLVKVRVDGNRRLYSVDFARLTALRSSLDSFWDTSLVALKRVAESEEKESHAAR